MSTTVVADEEEETSEVDVEVSSDVAIDVRPTNLDYTSAGDEGALDPGTERFVSDEGLEHLELENIGSEVLNEIYATSEMHENDPFADPGEDHITGNFVTLSTQTFSEDDSYDISGVNEITENHYSTRVEYYEETPPTYLSTNDEDDSIDMDDASFTADEVDVGRLRVGDVEYFFVAYTDGDNGEAVLRIGDTPHTPTELGTIDFTNEGDDYTQYDTETGSLDSDSSGADDVFQAENQDLVSFDADEYDGDSLINDGSSDVSGSSIEDDEDTEERSYNLYLDQNENDKLIRARWDTEVQSPTGDWTTDQTDSESQSFILETGDEDAALQPGENFPVDVGVQVPLGVDLDTVEPGTVTIIASEFE